MAAETVSYWVLKKAPLKVHLSDCETTADSVLKRVKTKAPWSDSTTAQSKVR